MGTAPEKATVDKKTKRDEAKTTIEIIRDIIVVIATIIAIISGALSLYNSIGDPGITIRNYLARPVVVTINNNPSFGGLVEAGSTRKFTLNSNSDFPVRVEWKMIRLRNDQGVEIGEVLSNVIPRADRGTRINITNVIGERTYFYPIINNNTDRPCWIVINDKLPGNFEQGIGYSNAHRSTNLTGYFKYASNSNITLYCDGKAAWHGTRLNIKSSDLLPLEAKSGITEVEFH